MPLVITGSNILNFEEWLKLCIHSVRCDIVGKTENSVTITATSDDCYTDTYGSGGEGYGLKISVNAGKTYILSWDSSGEGTQRIIVFAGESTVITESAESPLVFTVPSGYTYIKFRFGIRESGKTITFSNAQIMETTTYYYEQKPNSYPTLIDEAPLIEIPNSPVPYNTFNQNSEVNDGYPYIQDTCLTVPKEPYPICAFVQDGVTNDGYPYIQSLENIKQTPTVYIGSNRIKEIFYGSKPIKFIYYGKQKIY